MCKKKHEIESDTFFVGVYKLRFIQLVENASVSELPAIIVIALQDNNAIFFFVYIPT